MGTPRDTNSVFEELKSVIQELDSRVGTPVANTNGVVSNATLERIAPTESTWNVASTSELRGQPTLYNAANAISYEQPGVSSIVTVEGVLRFSPPESDIAKTHVLMTTAKVQGPKEFPLIVDAQGYSISIYTEKTLVASGQTRVTASPRLEVGETNIFVVVSGGTGRVVVTAPAEVECNAKVPFPGTPMWTSPGTSEYLNNEAGSLVIDLQWANDAYAGSWSVYRSSGVLVGSPDTAIDLGAGEFALYFLGVDLRSSALVPSTRLYVDEYEAGTVKSIEYQTGDTVITIKRENDAPVTPGGWEALNLYREGTYYARTRVGYDFSQVLQWRDTDVRRDTIYFYKITAHDFLTGSAESDFSPPLRVYPGKGPVNISVPAHAWLPRPTVALEGNLWLELTLIPAPGTRSVHIRAVGTNLSGAFDHEYDLDLPAYGQSVRHIIKQAGWAGEAGNEWNQYWTENSPDNIIYLTPYNEVGGESGEGDAGNTYELLVPRVFESSVNINAYEQMDPLDVDGPADFLTVWDTDEAQTKKITITDFVEASGALPEDLADMGDVDFISEAPALGDFLYFDGGAWVPRDLVAGDIDGLSGLIDNRLDQTQVIAGAWSFTTGPRMYDGLEFDLESAHLDIEVGASFLRLWAFSDGELYIDAVDGAGDPLAGGRRRLLHEFSDFDISADDINPGTITGSVTWQGNTIGSAWGGTGFNTYPEGSLLVGDASGELIRLPPGSENQSLRIQGGVPEWVSGGAVIASDVGSGEFIGTFSFNNPVTTPGLTLEHGAMGDPDPGETALYSVGDNLFFRAPSTTVRQALHSGSLISTWTALNNLKIGQTSHVLTDMDAAGDFAQPSGYRTMARNTSLIMPTGWSDYYFWNVLARRDSGGGYYGIAVGYGSGRTWIGYNNDGTAAPTWRELYGDGTASGGIPLAKLGTGSFGAGYTWNGGTINESYGGTGQTVYNEGDLLIGDATGGLERLLPGTSGQVLAIVDGVPEWVTNAATTANDIGSGEFPGTYSFNNSVTIPGISLEHAGMGNPDVGETALYSTGDNLFFRAPDITIREVLHDGSPAGDFPNWPASKITSGTFPVGSYVFQNNVTLGGATSLLSFGGINTNHNFVSWSGGALRKITNQGGLALFADSSVFVHAGDNITSHVSGAGITPTWTNENLYLSADNNVYISSALQSGWASGEQWIFAANGQTTFPTGTISAAGAMTSFTWQGNLIDELYGGTGIPGATIQRGDIIWANADGSWTTFTHPGASGRYLRTIGGSGSEGLEWSVGIDASDVGTGTFSGDYTFTADVRINNPNGGLLLDHITLGDDPPAGYTGLWSTGDNLRFQSASGTTREVLHDGTAGVHFDGSILRAASGSVGSPGISFSADTNTGIWRIGENIMGFSAAGIERFRVDTAGADVTGNLTATGEITGGLSDRRLKTNFVRASGIREKAREVFVGFFNYNEEAKKLCGSCVDTNEVKFGLIAQDLEAIVPQAAKLSPADSVKGKSVSGNNYLTYQDRVANAVLWGYVQELDDELMALRKELEELKNAD